MNLRAIRLIIIERHDLRPQPAVDMPPDEAHNAHQLAPPFKGSAWHDRRNPRNQTATARTWASRRSSGPRPISSAGTWMPYKHVVLGLIFLKYISDAFQELYDRQLVAYFMQSGPDNWFQSVARQMLAKWEHPRREFPCDAT